jgi:hypothetical protein
LPHPSARSTASAQDGSRRLADIPAGAGLGSSGSFTTALLRALHAHTKGIIHPRDLDAIRSWIHVLEPLTGYLILAERLFAEPKAFSEAWNFGPAVRRDAVYIPEGCAHGFQTLVDDCEPSTHRRSRSRPHVHGKKIVDDAL